MKVYRNSVLSAISFLAIIAITAGCSSGKKTISNQSNFPGPDSDSLITYLERTPCFGICPYYSISIYRSGYVLYEGKKDVENIGRFYSFLNNEQLLNIGLKAESLGYFDLDDEYRNQYLSDFPTIYIEVRFRGKRKKITHYHDEPPKNLVEMENYIDSLFGDNFIWQVHPDQSKQD